MNHIEIFTGAAGLALGLEYAGFEPIVLNEVDKNCCKTLAHNRPKWNILQTSIFSVQWDYKNIDLVSGGFPCQSFSYSGARLGIQDTRGTLFYEFARCVKEAAPICFLAENVKGLLSHDKGNTLKIIIKTFEDLGYYVFKPLLLNANDYEVAQKRDRVFIFGVKTEFKDCFEFSNIPTVKKICLKDILYPGKYYHGEVQSALGANYSPSKTKYFNLIPEGGNWRDLPENLKSIYMGGMLESSGGKTGVLKRLSMNQACPTLLTSPSQKQTERCHPNETRPLNIREYARIQSFPDEWIFKGSISQQYKQIGNAVPVNLAKHVGLYIYKQLKNLKKLDLYSKKHILSK